MCIRDRLLEEELAEARVDVAAQISALERVGEVLADPREAARALVRAADLAQGTKRDDAAARRALRRALERDPKNLEAFTKLRAALAPSSRDDALALKAMLERRLAIAEKDERAALLRELAGVSRGALGDPAGARAALRELAKDPAAPYAVLAELAALEEEDRGYSPAADLYVRILRLPGLGQRERRDAFWRLGLIYDEQLPDPKRAIASFKKVVEIGGLAEREATLKLARALAKIGEKTQAVDIFRRVAFAAADPKTRVALLIRIAQIWSELGDLEQAISAGQVALSVDERDLEVIEILASLYRQKGDEPSLRARRVHLDRAALAFRVVLKENAADAEAYRALVKIFGWLEEPKRAQIAAQLYVAFGGTDEAIRLMASRAEAAAPIPPERLADPALKEKLRHPAAAPGLRALLPPLTDALKKLLPPDIARHGVNAQDRVANGPARDLAAAYGKALGVPQVALYRQRLNAQTAALEHTSPPAVIFQSRVFEQVEGLELRFLVARALYLLGPGRLRELGRRL